MLALPGERPDNLITQRTWLVNQLHALLWDLLPGGARTDLTAAAIEDPARPGMPAVTARCTALTTFPDLRTRVWRRLLGC